jgi:hypothetical protein
VAPLPSLPAPRSGKPHGITNWLCSYTRKALFQPPLIPHSWGIEKTQRGFAPLHAPFCHSRRGGNPCRFSEGCASSWPQNLVAGNPRGSMTSPCIPQLEPFPMGVRGGEVHVTVQSASGSPRSRVSFTIPKPQEGAGTRPCRESEGVPQPHFYLPPRLGDKGG